MNLKIKSFNTIIVLIAISLFTLLPATSLHSEIIKENKTSLKAEQKDGKEKTAGEAYKNIKVLKDIPASRLIPTMRFMEAALGMECGSCHVRDMQKGWEFDKDTKPEKRKARKMIEMMDAINKNSFKGHMEVTCFTCHRGSPDPDKITNVLTVASLKERMEKEKIENETIQVPNRLNTAEDIIAKYVEATGGKEASEKITSLKMEGSGTSRGGNSVITIYKKVPDLYYADIKVNQGDMLSGFNGTIGWQSNHWGLRELKGDDLEAVKLDVAFIRPIDLDKIYSNLKLDDITVINGDTVYIVRGKATADRDAKLYFNTRTHLLERLVVVNKTPLGGLQGQTDYSDYREVNGVKFPFEITSSNYESVETIKFDKITANAPVEAGIFDMPKK